MRSLAPIRRLIANRPLAALVGASAVSGAGDWLYLTALPVLVYQRTGSPALVGLAAVGRLVPFFLLSMPAGVVADRFCRRSIVVLTETIRCLSMLSIACMCVVGVDITWILLMTLIAASAGTFSLPAIAAFAPELATDEAELGHANAIRATLDSLLGVLAPAFAGLLIVLGGLPIAFLLNGVSFAGVAVAVFIWRPVPRQAIAPSRETAPEERAVREFHWAHLVRRLAGPLALDGAISFASGALGVLAVLIAVDWLRAGEPFTGVLNAGAGVGGVAGGIAAGLVINGNSRSGLILGILGFAGSLILLGSAALPALAVAAMAVAFAALVLLDTLNMTAIQRLTSDGGTGRAIGLLHTLAALWMMAGVAIPTVFMATLGIQAAIVAPAIVMLALGAVSVLGTRTKRTEVDEANALAMAAA